MFRHVVLKKMTIHHFKNFDEIVIEFNDRTELVGGNNSGRTSIIDALSFVFSGYDSLGNKIEYIKEGKDFSWVEIVFDDEYGVERVIKRELKRSKSGNISQTLRLDHEVQKLTEFKKEFKKNLVLSSIHQKYFFGLSSGEGRDFLTDLFEIDKEEALERLGSPFAELIDSEELTTSSKVIDELRRSCDRRVKDLELEYQMNCVKIETVKNVITSMRTATDPKNEHVNSLIRRQEKTIETVEGWNENIVQAVQELNEKSFAYKEFKRKVLGIIEENLDTGLNKANIDLVRSSIDEESGEVTEKDVFIVTYNGRDINGCSSSEQLDAGIEIYKMISKRSDFRFPLVIDNGEILDRLPEEAESIEQIISLVYLRERKLSKFNDDSIVELETMETMPRLNKDEVIVYRLLGSDFELTD